MKAKLVLLAVVACCATACVVHDHGHVAYRSGPYYDYYYYPETDVYFYPSARVYYWHAGHRWHSGRHLPHTVVINESSRQSLRLHSRDPWRAHRPHRK